MCCFPYPLPVEDEKNESALDLACNGNKEGHPAIIEHLLDKGAKDLKSRGKSVIAEGYSPTLWHSQLSDTQREREIPIW
jgi:hypothetical protein